MHLDRSASRTFCMETWSSDQGIKNEKENPPNFFWVLYKVPYWSLRQEGVVPAEIGDPKVFRDRVSSYGLRA